MMNRALPIFAVGIALAILIMYTVPTWKNDIQKMKANIAADESALATAKQYSAQESLLASQKNAIDPANLQKLNTFLPDSVDNVGLMLDLNGLAARSGLVLSKVDVANGSGSDSSDDGESGNANSIGSVDLSVSAIGTYSSLQTFLEGIESSERLLDVQALTVGGSATGIYNYSLTVRIYWLES